MRQARPADEPPPDDRTSSGATQAAPSSSAAASSSPEEHQEASTSADRLLERPLAARLLWAGLGILAVALGALGILLPGLPTTPFLILAAACFARSSTRLYEGLLRNRRFGPLIRQYRAGRGVPRRAKRLALTLMAVFLLFALGPGMPKSWFWPRVLLLVVGAIGATYLLRLPTWDGPLEDLGPESGTTPDPSRRP